MSQPRQFVITLRDVGGPDDPPTAVRLRAALKRFRRSFSLACVAAVEIKPDGSAVGLDDSPGPVAEEDGAVPMEPAASH